MENTHMEVIEDWRLVCVATATGWRAYLVLEDGVELVEDVDLSD